MTFINLGPHLVRTFLSWFIFYYVFNLIYQQKDLSSRRKSFTYIILFFISFILDGILRGYSYLIILLLIYWSFWPKKQLNYYLLNSILLDMLVKFLAVILPSRILVNFFPVQDLKSYSFALTVVLFQFLFSTIFLYFYRYFDLDKFFRFNTSLMTTVVLGYVYIVLYASMLFMKQFHAYNNLITGILLFVIVQCGFMAFVFIHEHNRQRKINQNRFSEEEIKNLKIYTDKLEQDQLKLRHFKHDYKNLLFSLKTVADEHDGTAINQALDRLENYSDSYLDDISMEMFEDLNNIKNSDLKSLLISKLNTINQDKINCQFHCKQTLTEIPMNILDLIKLLDTAIDNAIEFTKDQENGQIQLAITEEGQQLAFLINNSITDKPAFAKEHERLQMLHIKALKNKYSNLFIQYSQNEKWFRLHITLIK